MQKDKQEEKYNCKIQMHHDVVEARDKASTNNQKDEPKDGELELCMNLGVEKAYGHLGTPPVTADYLCSTSPVYITTNTFWQS